MTTTPLIVRNCRWVAVPGSADARGSVNFLESGKGLDFEPRRLFWIHHVAPGQWRGRKTAARQLVSPLVAPALAGMAAPN